MNLLIEQLTAPQAARDRERMMLRDDLLTTARAAQCRERRCHPFIERMSQVLVSAGVRLNAWVAPSHRRVSVAPCRESTPASAS